MKSYKNVHGVNEHPTSQHIYSIRKIYAAAHKTISVTINLTIPLLPFYSMLPTMRHNSPTTLQIPTHPPIYPTHMPYSLVHRSPCNTRMICAHHLPRVISKYVSTAAAGVIVRGDISGPMAEWEWFRDAESPTMQQTP